MADEKLSAYYREVLEGLLRVEMSNAADKVAGTVPRERLRIWLREAALRGELSPRVNSFVWLLAIEVDDATLDKLMYQLEGEQKR